MADSRGDLWRRAAQLTRSARQSRWAQLLATAWLLAIVASFACAQNRSPAEAVKAMRADAGLSVKLVASEPLVRQPVCIEFDDRGRLWVIQYLQYPNPEGLKRTQVDRYSRTIYDRIPDPPPHGPRGADRITILTDQDHDGRMDWSIDFIDGLNLATGLAFGYDGVFVLNVPYLLFYPDRNRDDVPDSDPEVLLSGFGMEDAHSVANSLTWGPDGWLYGCQGSTVTANIRGIEFQQGVWRYHPRTHAFELFCEGGGNAWGLDFDAQGNLLYSTNYGGYVLVHGVQGGNYVKSFAKHGALHNPHAYGYFEHAPHKDFRGGHVTVGGIVYQGGALPNQFNGKYVAGDLLGHAVRYHDIQPFGSTFRTETMGLLLDSHDSWFAPTDLTVGPSGSIYVADWHDARTAHPDPDAQWDRTNGRVFKVSNASSESFPESQIDLTKLSIAELIRMHEHSNQWFVRRARQELARRGASAAIPELLDLARQPNNPPLALEALWSCITLSGPASSIENRLSDDICAQLLASPHAAVRRWTLRWLGDGGRVSADMAVQLDALAEHEEDVHVRQQLASTAARLPAAQALPIINANINRDIDREDPFLPLQWWWAVERHSITGSDEVLRRFTRPALWRSRLGRDVLLPRLVRRYSAAGDTSGLDYVTRLLSAAPDDSARQSLWPSLIAGWQEVPAGQRVARDAVANTHPLAAYLLQQWRAQPHDLRRSPSDLARLVILLGNNEPRQIALDQATSTSADSPTRLAALGLLAEFPADAMLDPLLRLLDERDEPIRLATILALARVENDRVTEVLLRLLEEPLPRNQNTLIHDVLLSRRSSALAWLRSIDREKSSKERTSLEQARRLSLFQDPDIDKLVLKHWGKLDSASPEEKLAEVRRLNNDLRADAGDPRPGYAQFKKHCAVCHRLHGEGGQVGPDLASANRADREFLLVSMVDPSSVIRKEYLSLIVRTTDDRVLTGIPKTLATGELQLINAKNETLTLTSSEIDEVRESPVSLMPEDIYKQLQPQELRDLFAYLQSTSGSVPAH